MNTGDETFRPNASLNLLSSLCGRRLVVQTDLGSSA